MTMLKLSVNFGVGNNLDNIPKSFLNIGVVIFIVNYWWSLFPFDDAA